MKALIKKGKKQRHKKWDFFILAGINTNANRACINGIERNLAS